MEDKDMENKRGPEVYVGEGKGPEISTKENRYLKYVKRAAEENRLETYYQHSKTQLEEQLEYFIEADDKEMADSVREDIIMLEEACRIVKNGGNKTADKICPKCGKGYDSKTMFCLEDGKELIEVWKCHNCGEDLKNVHGYSCVNHCPNCGKPVAAMQRKALDSIKKSGRNSLKRICSNEKCGAVYENSAKFCGKCGRLVVAMQCACGEIFRQKKDGSFDKYCPVCGKPNPVEKIKITSKIGDIIEFGSWRYEADGTERPIKWQIMEIDGDGTAVLLSCYAIDNHAYHNKRVDITWAESDIRKWLNGEFYENAFSNEEKRRIIPVRLKNNDNNETFTQEYIDFWKMWGLYEKGDEEKYIGRRMNGKGGADTTDKVWLLSLDDMKKYSHIFKTDKDRQLKPTPNMCTRYNFAPETNEYVKKNNCVGNCWWWLRSPGNLQLNAAGVANDGFVYASGCDVADDGEAVRAALKINLKNL